ncbi:MAG: hypothetical protein R2828_34415 [Saprospiraceae bacterium]
MKLVIQISLIVLTFFFSSCQEKIDEKIYPEFIVEHDLEKYFDEARWELYKLNSLFVNDEETDIYVDLSKHEYGEYQNRWTELVKKPNGPKVLYNELEKQFGKEAIQKYIELDLYWYADTSIVFKGDEIRMTFLPNSDFTDNYYDKLQTGFYYTIVYRDDSIVRVGRDDYFESQITDRILGEKEIEFLSFIENQDVNVNPWIINRLRRKRELH